MTTLLLVASCARPARVIFPQPPPGTEILFAVATWNMHSGRGDLERFLDDLASGALTGAPPRDYIAMLQEDVESGDQAGATAIARGRGLSAFYVPVRSTGTRTSGNAILSTRPLENPASLALLRQRQPRSAAVATVTIGGERLFVVDVHLENRVTWWRGLFSDTARGRQAGALLMMLPQHTRGILGGDLNTWLGPREPAWRVLARRFPDTPADPPQSTFHDRLVLDHLFFDLPDGWLAIRRVVKDAYGSDHHPVVAIVSGQRAAGSGQRAVSRQ